MKLNAVLKSWSEVTEAIKNLNSLNLPPHPDTVKSWDTWKIINFINKNGKKDSNILDVGCNGSPVLPILRQLGFTNLNGCDVDLNIRKRRLLKRIKNRLSGEDPDKLLSEMLENSDKFYHLTIQDLEKTKYETNMFDFVSSLSVIEHGVNIRNYFSEMSRILKSGGFLLTSTDYWPKKIETASNVYNRSAGDIIFDRNEIEEAVDIAQKSGLELYEPIEFNYRDKVVKWKKTKREYTFLFFGLRKK